MDAIKLGIFSSRLDAVCDEMGATLQAAAFSPNIRDRLDYSCAVFDAKGELCAQAAHIPVHLGSMAYAMQSIVSRVEWKDGDMLILNDPYLGGTHLPDITLIAPLFVDDELIAFVVNRAHHADIGADSPGCMPVSSSLYEEGQIIAPQKIVRQSQIIDSVLQKITAENRNPTESSGDFYAQISANRAGLLRLGELIHSFGTAAFCDALTALNQYAETLASSALAGIPDGDYRYTDYLDDDGQGTKKIPISIHIAVASGKIKIDFDGTATQVDGNVNCPLSVAAAAVFYVFRCLMPEHTPACAGAFRHISLTAKKGSLVNAQYPAAVTAGNVETSTRIVDCVIGALLQAIPQRLAAASHGSMNNVAMGSDTANGWDYYETIGGGAGASAMGNGLSAVQTHMTNTLNTPVEVLESRFPIRMQRYQIRHGSGGKGKYDGGDGLIREYCFLQPTLVTLLTERRDFSPWGFAGGENAEAGKNLLNSVAVAAKQSLSLKQGDVLSIQTPGGGAWGNE